MVNVFGHRPNLVIALTDRAFVDSGISYSNTYQITRLGGDFLTYVPSESVNAISGFEKDKVYVIFASENMDLTGIVENTVPDSYTITPGINVLANEWFAGIALQTVSFATAGLTGSNLEIIFEVGSVYRSFVPGAAINAISGFNIGQAYYGRALADMDLSDYLIPPLVIPSDIEQDVDAYKYYGTESTDEKGFYNVPVRFFADEASLPATGTENIIYVAKAENTSWYWDGATYQQITGAGGGGGGDLQSVTDAGNITTNDIRIRPVLTDVVSLSSLSLGSGNYMGLVDTFNTSDSTAAQLAPGIATIQADDGIVKFNSVDGTKNIYLRPPFTWGTTLHQLRLPDKSGTLAINQDADIGAGTQTDGYVLKLSSGVPTWQTESGGSSYTDEQAQDAIGTILTDSDTVDFTYDDATPAITADVKKQMSIASDASGLKLSGDSATPGNSKYYGTDSGGTKGFFALPGGITSETDPLSWHLTGTSTLTGNVIIAVGTNTLQYTGSHASSPLLQLTATGTSQQGLNVSATGTTAVYGKTTALAAAAGFEISRSSNSSVLPALNVVRSTTGTAVAGIGVEIDMYASTNGGGTQVASELVAKWTDAANATRTSQFEVLAIDNTNSVRVLALQGAVVTTSNATPTTLKTILITDETAGILEVLLVGRENTTAGKITGKKSVGYRKDGGTLTLDSVTDVVPTSATGTISTATWSVSASGNNIIIQVTGVAATTINWKCNTNQIDN